jgi:hypothetical protein
MPKSKVSKELRLPGSTHWYHRAIGWEASLWQNQR